MRNTQMRQAQNTAKREGFERKIFSALNVKIKIILSFDVTGTKKPAKAGLMCILWWGINRGDAIAGTG